MSFSKGYLERKTSKRLPQAIAPGRKYMAWAALKILKLYAFLFMLVGSPALAQTRPLLQFQHTAWTLQSGAPSQIYALAQTKDGYLWLGAANGLFRFDGVTFEDYQPTRGEQLLHSGVRSLWATADGGLWIGYTAGDTGFLKNGILQNQRFNEHLHSAGGCVYSIIARRDGSIWAATLNGPIKLMSGTWRDARETVGTDIKSSYKLFEDSRRTLWMTSEKWIYRLPEGAGQFEKTQLRGGDAAMAETSDGIVWVANDVGIHDATDALTAGTHPRSSIPFNDFALDLRLDTRGALWAIGPRTGITYIDRPNEAAGLAATLQGKFLENFSVRDGLTSEQALSSLEDREGNMWIATADGLDRFRLKTLNPAPLPSKFGFYALATEADGSVLIGTEADGLQRLSNRQLTRVPTGQESRISCVYRASDGKLWLGGNASLGYLEHGRFVAVPIPDAAKIPERDTRALTTGPNGDLWMQTNASLGIFRLHDGQWSEVPESSGNGTASVMTTGRDGRVWAGYYKKSAITIFDGDKRTSLYKEQGLTVGAVQAIYEVTEGMLIGGEHGLDVMRDDHLAALKFAGEMKIDGISGLMRMEDGTLWINSLPGILRVSADEAEQALKDPSHAMRYRLFNYLDGLAGKPPQFWPLPSIVRGKGSTLWFTTTNGVVSIDTAHIRTNTIAPPVSIKEVIVDGMTFDPSAPLTLSKGAKDLQIDYTALSLSIPERVRFRYQLEGYDKEWQEAGTRRQVFYTHLPPGDYVFHVIACNDDGLWNDTGANVALYLPPTFPQSWYFKALIAALFLAATWFLYLLRIRRETSKMQAKIQERFAERERIARELHDTLFQSVEGSLLHLNAVTSRLPVEQQVKDQLRQAYGEVDRVMGQARSLVFDLRRPVDSQDLASTIMLFAEEVGGLSEIQVAVLVRGVHCLLKAPVHNEVLKIAKEGIWNAFRHAQAQHIVVSINYSPRFFELSVKDDGVGIDPAVLERGGREGHWGLPGIRERCAYLKALLVLRNREDGGTELLLRIRNRDAYQSSGWSFPSRLWRLSQGVE